MCCCRHTQGAQFIVRKRSAAIIDLAPAPRYYSYQLLIRENRYSEFDELRERLIETFPRSRVSIPTLPPKSVVCTCFTSPAVVEPRRIWISGWKVSRNTLKLAQPNSAQSFSRLDVKGCHIFFRKFILSSTCCGQKKIDFPLGHIKVYPFESGVCRFTACQGVFAAG